VSDVRKPSPEEMKPPPPIEPDPGLDRLLQMMGSAVPAEAAEGSGYFDNLGTRTEDRINAHLTSKALGGGFPSTVDMRVAGVMVPKRRTPGWVFAVAIGGSTVALGLLGTIGYLLMTRPGGLGGLGGDKVEGVEYVASRAPATAAATAAPATVAVVATAAETAAVESAPATGEEIAYAEDEETKKTMAGMGKGKPGAAAGKKPAGAKAKGPGDDAPDGATGTASAAVATVKGSKVTDPSKAGAFDDDLTKLLEKKKDDAAGPPPDEPAAAPAGKVLTADDVKKVLGTAKGRIGLCGKIEETDITVSFEINADGTIGKLAAKPPHGADAVGACVTGILRDLKFPEHDGKPLKVTQAYSLKSEE